MPINTPMPGFDMKMRAATTAMAAPMSAPRPRP